MVDPSELEQCVRAACGTWSRAEFKDYLNSTNLTKREKKMEMQRFKTSEKQLRDLCKSECYSCSADVLSCLRTGTVQSCVDIHNETLGAGGPSSATKKKTKKTKKSGPRKKLERRTTEEQTRKSVAFSKRHHGPESVEQCPQ